MEWNIRGGVVEDAPALTKLNREELGYDYPARSWWLKQGSRWWDTYIWNATICSMQTPWSM